MVDSTCHADSERADVLISQAKTEGVELCVLGTFANTGRLEVRFDNETLVGLDLRFLHKGLPLQERAAIWSPPAKNGSHKYNGRPSSPQQSKETLRWMLAHLNVCSREWVIRQYDHEVQAATVIKPMLPDSAPLDEVGEVFD